MSQKLPSLNNNLLALSGNVPVSSQKIPVSNKKLPALNNNVPVSSEKLLVSGENVAVSSEKFLVADENVAVLSEKFRILRPEFTGLNWNDQGLSLEGGELRAIASHSEIAPPSHNCDRLAEEHLLSQAPYAPLSTLSGPIALIYAWIRTMWCQVSDR